jgi:pyridinium-3,5-bisthiocarboxylic acid mononucleotide nickel chelatase
MRCLYFDCFSGISGDMTLAALIDLGVPRRHLLSELHKLSLSNYRIQISAAMCHGISGKRLRVITAPEKKGHHHHHHHRTLVDIQKMITASTLSARVKEGSLAVFERLAQAEARVHRKKPSEVHFHEVGAVDSIIDIVGAVIALEYLDVQHITASAIPLGSGFVTCEHGTLPVPAPATVLLLKNIPVYDNGVRAELVTPTGAALISTFAAAFGAMPAMRIQAVGYGAGSREHAAIPNMLRVIQGELQTPAAQDRVCVLEATIDDMSPEWYGFAMEKLFEAGALDVAFIPAQMKKNRPGVLLSVVCRPEDRHVLGAAILEHTTTAGVRMHQAERMLLARKTAVVKTRLGPVCAKVLYAPEGKRLVPEYEACAKLARKKNIPLRNIHEAFWAAAQGSNKD